MPPCPTDGAAPIRGPWRAGDHHAAVPSVPGKVQGTPWKVAWSVCWGGRMGLGGTGPKSCSSQALGAKAEWPLQAGQGQAQGLPPSLTFQVTDQGWHVHPPVLGHVLVDLWAQRTEQTQGRSSLAGSFQGQSRQSLRERRHGGEGWPWGNSLGREGAPNGPSLLGPRGSRNPPLPRPDPHSLTHQQPSQQLLGGRRLHWGDSEREAAKKEGRKQGRERKGGPHRREESATEPAHPAT